jgi:cytochrome P450
VGETLTLENLLQLASQFPYLDAVLRESDRVMASDDINLDYFAKEPVTIDGCRIPSDASNVSGTTTKLR